MKGMFMYHYMLRGGDNLGCVDVSSLEEIAELMAQTPYKVTELRILDTPLFGALWSSYCPYPVTAKVGKTRMCVGYSSFIDYERTQKADRGK